MASERRFRQCEKEMYSGQTSSCLLYTSQGNADKRPGGSGISEVSGRKKDNRRQYGKTAGRCPYKIADNGQCFGKAAINTYLFCKIRDLIKGSSETILSF